MENGGSGNYYPVLNRITRRWSITCTEIQRFGPSFKTREACARAIEEVIKPMGLLRRKSLCGEEYNMKLNLKPCKYCGGAGVIETQPFMP